MTDKFITTVTIDRCDSEYAPWVSSFSSRALALEFKRKVIAKLETYGISDVFVVFIDSGELNDEQYLDWIDNEFRKEENEDD